MFARVTWLLLLGLSVCAQAAPPPLVLSGHPEFAPLMVQDGEQIRGVFPALAERVFRELKIQTSNRYVGPWARVQFEAKQGNVDVIVGIYPSDERKTYLQFVPTALLQNPSVVMVKKGNTLQFQRWEDLRGLRLGRIIGDQYTPEFEAFLADPASRITIDRAPTLEQNFKKLLADRVDAIVYSRYVGEYVLAKMKLRDQVQILPKPVFVGTFYMAFSNKSPYQNRIPEVDRILQQYSKTGVLERLIAEQNSAAP